MVIAQAQNEEKPSIDTNLINKYKNTKGVSYIIKTNLLPIFYSKLPLTAEYRLLGEFAISTKQSLSVSGSYLGKTFLYNLIYNSTNPGQPLYIKGYRFQLAYRYYLVQKKITPMGLYLSPHFSYFSTDYSYSPFRNNTDFDKLTNFNANLLLGFQIIVRSKIVFDLFTGWGYNKYTYTQYVFVNNIKKITQKNPSEFGIINDTPINFIPISFNFGIAF